MAAAVTDQAIADLFADIDTLAAEVKTASATIAAYAGVAEAKITAWTRAQEQSRATWDAKELRNIKSFEAGLKSVVSAYTDKLKKHLRAEAPDATHNRQPEPATPVTGFPSNADTRAQFSLKKNGYALHPEAGKVPLTWVPGFTGCEKISTANSVITDIVAGGSWTGTVDTTSQSVRCYGTSANVRKQYSCVVITVASSEDVTVTVSIGSSATTPNSVVKTFQALGGIRLVDYARAANDTIEYAASQAYKTYNNVWPYFRVSIANSGTETATVTITTELATEADPVIAYRPIYNGFLREECTENADRYMLGGKVIKGTVYARTSYHAVTTLYDSGLNKEGGYVNPAGSNSTTGMVERILTTFAARFDAPVAGCTGIENRMFVPIYLTRSTS